MRRPQGVERATLWLSRFFFINKSISNAGEESQPVPTLAMAYIFTHENTPELSSSEINDTIIGLDISKSVEEYCRTHPGQHPTPMHIMAFTQRAWVLAPAHANTAKLLLACCRTADNRRIVTGVYRFGRDGNDSFVKSPWDDADNRYVFLAEPAEEAEWNRYIGRLLPAPRQGEANPVKYYYQQ